MKRYLMTLNVALLSWLAVLASSTPLFAQGPESTGGNPTITITPARTSAGPQISWGQCPCIRWVVQVQAGGAQIETREFLISTDALFKLHDEQVMDFRRFAVQLFNVGAAEALWKGGHLGIGFSGVTWGEDRDRGYSDLIQTGFYTMINLILTDAMRLDLHSGYDFERMRINDGPLFSRGILQQAAVLRWQGNRWSGNISGHIGMDASRLLDWSGFSAGAAVSARRRLFNFHDLQLSLGFNLSYEHDGFRDLMGLAPDLVTGSLLMDLSYVSTLPQGAQPRP